MEKLQTRSRIHELGVLAVLRGPTPELTLRMVEALIAGGVLGIEITFTTPDALDVMKELERTYGEGILLGMGTITEVQQAEQARAVGAHFIVSPHYELDVAKAMTSTGLVTLIGAYTPSEIIAAHRSGADIIKLFPASLGGPEYLNALRGPFPGLNIMPSGGVTPNNVQAWYEAGAIAVVAGSSLCPASLALESRFDEITYQAKSFVKVIQSFRSKEPDVK
jgi:2-dehydro-3-deoxyphosphogluconate aldolase/(4S)-4-hydroxy-2-oxoglutarate aldolase